MSEVYGTIKRIIKKTEGHLISSLQEIQDKYNYLPQEALKALADELNLPLINVYEVATFYKSFSLTPKGKHICTVCVGTACHVRGSSKVVDALSNEMDIPPNSTTEDMQFTLETVNCLGCCAIGPIMVLDGEYHGEMTALKAVHLIADKKRRKSEKTKKHRRVS